MGIYVLIPAYNPSEKFIKLVSELLDNKFSIIVVDDGSKPETKHFFEKVKNKVILLSHITNLGKGRALKTGFSYYLKNCPESSGIITVDCDGQHSITDILKIKDCLETCEYDMVLGVRNFTSKNVPKPNKFGNVLTKNLLNFVTGLDINDTQTGLRGLSPKGVTKTINVLGEHFEYEMNVLFEINSKKIKHNQISIKTIYLKDNKSNFKRIKDSYLVYKGFNKYFIYYLMLYIFQILLFSYCLKKINSSSFLEILLIVFITRSVPKIFDLIVNDLKYYNLKKDIKKIIILNVLITLIESVLLMISSNYLSLNLIVTKIIADIILLPFIIKFKL